jgi:hypothetical protein
VGGVGIAFTDVRDHRVGGIVGFTFADWIMKCFSGFRSCELGTITVVNYFRRCNVVVFMLIMD